MGDINLSEIIKIIAALILLISSIAKLQIEESDLNISMKIILFFVIGITILFVIYYLIRFIFLKKRGVRGEYIKLKLLLKKYNPILISHYSNFVHKFHHSITTAIQQVKLNNYPLNDTRTRTLTAELLRECSEMLTQIIGVEFSINIKLFEKLDYSNDNIVDIENVVLKTYERFSSEIERENIKEEKHSARSSHELFKINKSTKEDIDDLISRVKANSQSDEKYKYNFGYDFAFGPTKHYYLSNNLEKDIKNNKFHCTSNSREKYYNSLGVFLISPPLDSGDYIDVNNVLGIIIIDTLEKNVFYDRYIACIMGYYSHRFYNFFSIFQNKDK